MTVQPLFVSLFSVPPDSPATLADALVVIADLRAENAALRQQLATLQAQFDELLRRLSQNSSSSSKPPSSGGPATPSRSRSEAASWARTLFRLWHQLQGGHQVRPRWQQRMKKVRACMEALLEEGAAWKAPLAKRCEQLWRQRASLWTFVQHEGVEPTNNAAERALRPAVVWRKKNSGPRSEGGKKFVERVLSVVETARKQGREVWKYLQAATAAWVRQEGSSKLLAQGP